MARTPLTFAGFFFVAAALGCGAPIAPPAMGVRRVHDDVLVERPADVFEGAKLRLDSPSLTAGISGQGPLKEAEIEGWLAEPRNHEPLDFILPVGLRDDAARLSVPAENPLTRAKIELGRQLFFDKRLSKNAQHFSCGSCHPPRDQFAHPGHNLERPEDALRTVPVVFNRILSGPQFWDGRSASLEAQAVEPIRDAREMANTHEDCLASIAAIPGYRLQFEKIFGELSMDAVGKALASFQRAIVTGPSHVDVDRELSRLKGRELTPEQTSLKTELETLAGVEPLSPAARRGQELFRSDRLGCAACHTGANYTDEQYHNLGVGTERPEPDPGRFRVTSNPQDHGAFKTPTLRNIAHTHPYMHDGQLDSLQEVIAWYAKGGQANPNLSPKLRPFELSSSEVQDLIAFLQALSGALSPVQEHRLPR